MRISKEQIEQDLQGFYRTGCFHIYLSGSFSEKFEDMSLEDLGTFTHEYIHYLQNISTPYGIFEANTRHQAAIECFQQATGVDAIFLPYEPTYSNELQERLRWLSVMNGDNIPEVGCDDVIDDSYRMSFGFEDYRGEHRSGRRVRVIYRTQTGEIKTRYIGALDIKEGMAVAYQGLLGDTRPHPDVPYNLLSILCKQHFPSVYADKKKFICICYTSLFELSPASFFISLCLDERVDSSKSGFQIFDEFVWKAPVKTFSKEVNVPYFFNRMVDTFKQSIKGFLRIDTPFIDTILDSVKLIDGNVPVLNVINTNEPINVENIKALVQNSGLPFIHAQGRGWFFPSLEGQGSPDVVHMVGITWMYEFLTQRDKCKIGICPLASMCESLGDFCYDAPWNEQYEKCSFRLISKDLDLEGKIKGITKRSEVKYLNHDETRNS